MIGPRVILHIISGNTAHAGLQSLIHGLLVGARNWCKIPVRWASGDRAIPGAPAVRTGPAGGNRRDLPGDWLDQADAVVVLAATTRCSTSGSASRRGNALFPRAPGQFRRRFFRSRISSVPGAARDASLYDQQGCLSPHLFYVPAEFAREYAARLAAAMAEFEKENPRRELTTAEQSEIVTLRQEFAFCAANEPAVGYLEQRGFHRVDGDSGRRFAFHPVLPEPGGVCQTASGRISRRRFCGCAPI